MKNQKKTGWMQVIKSLFRPSVKWGKWSSLTKEERLYAKAMMYGARCGSAMQSDADGVVRIQTISSEDIED
jgi:hypothetical protein